MNKRDGERRKEAVALGYDPSTSGQDAPRMLAKGKGIVADNIIEKALANDVPIQEDPSLVEVLSQLDINERIPEELYGAVAEVFAFIYRADRAAGKQK
ncbi:EscU/YscU/HrcU family type III secretion system export apparatus switch protein [Bacillus sp. T33-2]|uniref:EscU/YscU/HrcU family type III secretion system export apparatus switch protein n=1 Tax=Bacillus sp. T33-2 TaxID=2054168 RepID=UPI000C77CC29|nr:EscU/YscU/HrcU family type III secretion system export apparatus switch protein [Bacillus sp. T33-2]PLR97291.1 hypothetical protein CVD19_07325 [Bacillus sp. T33-2]